MKGPANLFFHVYFWIHELSLFLMEIGLIFRRKSQKVWGAWKPGWILMIAMKLDLTKKTRCCDESKTCIVESVFILQVTESSKDHAVRDGNCEATNQKWTNAHGELGQAAFLLIVCHQ